jgi:hypothetical protein
MALVTVSNSLCARNWSSSDCQNFNNLNSAFTSTVYAARSEFPVTNSSWSGQVGKHASLQKRWPSSSFLEKRKRRYHVRPNASFTPESQTTDKKVDSSSSDGPSVQSHLELLQQITSERSLGTSGLRKTIAQQLEEDVEVKEAEEVTIALGNGKLDSNSSYLTISQKRNIRRQDYLNKVSKRDDAPFFTIVALCVLAPPAAILGVAVATGYIDLLP